MVGMGPEKSVAGSQRPERLGWPVSDAPKRRSWAGRVVVRGGSVVWMEEELPLALIDEKAEG